MVTGNIFHYFSDCLNFRYISTKNNITFAISFLDQEIYPHGQISKKISSGINAMKKIKDFTNSDTLKSVYYGLVQPHFDYCCEVWNPLIEASLNDYKNFTTYVLEL